MEKDLRSSDMGLQTLKDGLNSPAMARYYEKGINVPPQELSPLRTQIRGWEEFCKLNDVFPRYRDASIDSLTIPDEGESFTEKAKRYMQSPASLILMGKSGRGKTHIMFALIRALFEQRNLRLSDIRYFDHVDLERRLQEEVTNYKSSRHLIASLCEVPVLVLDDFGIDTGTTRHERDFYEIINKRFGKGLITIISTNLDEKAIYKAYGERIHSRLKESVIIEFNGPDLRG